jgi:hypothetical protein
MTITDLASLLRASDPPGRSTWNSSTVWSGGNPPARVFQEIECGASPSPHPARYIGPGPWLDAILSSAKGVQEGE